MQSSKSTRAHGALCQCFVEVCRFIAVLSLDGERFPRPAVAALWDEREGVFVERAAGEVGRFGEAIGQVWHRIDAATNAIGHRASLATKRWPAIDRVVFCSCPNCQSN